MPIEIQREYAAQKRILLKDVEARRRDLVITDEVLELLEKPFEFPEQKGCDHEFVCVLCEMKLGETENF